MEFPGKAKVHTSTQKSLLFKKWKNLQAQFLFLYNKKIWWRTDFGGQNFLLLVSATLIGSLETNSSVGK